MRLPLIVLIALCLPKIFKPKKLEQISETYSAVQKLYKVANLQNLRTAELVPSI